MNFKISTDTDIAFLNMNFKIDILVNFDLLFWGEGVSNLSTSCSLTLINFIYISN